MPDKIYIVKRTFASLRHNGIEKEGYQIPAHQLSEGSAKRMIKKGLIYPSYSTKEDKAAAKVEKKIKATIKHDTSQYYFVMRGEEVIDRVWQKKRAEEVADELNKS